MKQLRICILAALLLTSFAIVSTGQVDEREPGRNAFVDDEGILRWENNGEEICYYGVNYTVPFAHAYRAANYLDVDHESAIEQDVYHLVRLGLDAFRVHVWDCEISDTLGNLIENEHLRLFDYQMNVMKSRGFKFIITPIAFWGNGYPEPEEKTPGFSTKYGKGNCLTDPGAIRAQEVYLEQFVNHINPFTGIAYKDDPDIIAFEVCNEPHHSGTIDETRDFINRMVHAISNTGCRKPVFYNVSHSIHLGRAYFSSDIQGGTFQWYPSGLVAGHEVKGNFLPNASVYNIPYDTVPGFHKMAKIVYEYDAADIGRSYIHPYMAKSFKEAGIQFVTQFSYDPMFMAYANTEYQTHYMNLAYAPRKALSLMIAGEVFRRLPLGKKTATYPADTIFDVFRVSYSLDLAEMITGQEFIYTNNTLSLPPAQDKLERIAGYGSSSVVGYEGCGAYFLDRLDRGVWRLEVMPDAIWIRDPFERASLDKEVSVIIHREWPMVIDLPDLGKEFSVNGINEGNEINREADGGYFRISPGTYLLVRKGQNTKFSGKDNWNNFILDEFVAPPTSIKKNYLLHDPPEEITSGKPVKLSARVITVNEPEIVELFLFAGWRPDRLVMEKKSGYTWEVEIPADKIREGFLRYYIVVKDNGGCKTYPTDAEGQPADWDFFQQDPYTIAVVDKDQPVVLFNAGKDGEEMYGNSWFMTAPSSNPGETVVQMRTWNLERAPHILASRFFFKEKIRGRTVDLDYFSELVFKGYAISSNPFPVELSLVLDDGTTYGGTVIMQPGQEYYSLDLDELERVKTINLPGAFPVFLPFYAIGEFDKPFDIHHAESIQISIGPGIPESDYDQPYGLAIEKVFLK